MLEGYLVPKAGIEPARVLPHRFLRPTRLPIPPLRHGSACSPERVSGSETRLQNYGFFLFAQVTFEKNVVFIDSIDVKYWNSIALYLLFVLVK